MVSYWLYVQHFSESKQISLYSVFKELVLIIGHHQYLDTIALSLLLQLEFLHHSKKVH